MLKKLQEWLHSLLDVNVNNNSNLISNEDNVITENRTTDRWEIEGSPFWIVRQDTEYNIIFGKFRITKDSLGSKEQCMEWLRFNTWNVVTQICIIVNLDKLNVETDEAVKKTA